MYNTKHTMGQIEMGMNGLKTKIYQPISTLKAEGTLSKEPIPYANRKDYPYTEYKVGDVWGSLFDCAWFHVTGTVPTTAVGKHVVLLLDFNGEGLIFDDTGCPIRGITNVTSQYDYNLGMPGKRIVQFCEDAKGGESVDLWIDAACNDLFGEFKGEGKIANLEIAIVDDTARELYYDITVLHDMLSCLDATSPAYFSILYSLQKTVNCFCNFDEEEYQRALIYTKKELSKKGGDNSLQFFATGHAHLDLAWLWPIRETRRKGGRSFSTQIELINKTDDYIFGASQPQLYDWVKEDYPALYEKIKEKVADGRWELQGGTWVEPDTNIPSGESLVRQFLYGQKFFREEFGETMKILWLPDVFGYSGALPQIMKKSGCDYFQTIKLSWSRVNKFPYHTFNWKGIDGTEVLVHMPPEGTYGSACLPHSINKAALNYQEKGICDSALLLYGISDGGGGCGPEHMERMSRIKNMPNLYPVKPAKSIDFFEHIVKDREQYPTYKGELYVEAHQGTLTTQANTKKYNRKLEILFHDVELLSTFAFLKKGFAYPKETLETLWKEFLLYQFHDILPGSSIKRVYDECEERYASIEQSLLELFNQAQSALKVSDKTVAFNSLPWDRVENHTTIKGFDTAPICQENSSDEVVTFTERLIETSTLKIVFNDNGEMTSIFDKQNNREIVKENDVANQLAVYHDMGDAWDFPINYREKNMQKFSLKTVTVSKEGNTIKRSSEYVFQKSTLQQVVEVTIGSNLINFTTSVDWNEDNKMLRAEFPLSIESDYVNCDIQYGHIKRTTLENNSYEYAMIEVAAHKYVDLSDTSYGVALLNDCKYAYHTKNGMLSLALLRSPNYPGINADKGEHTFSYALYLHTGDLLMSDVQKVSYEYNYPVRQSFELEALPFVAKVNHENIIIDCVKLAEDNTDVIVRMYESKGLLTNAHIQIEDLFSQCLLNNLIEDDIKSLDLTSNEVCIEFKPFEVHTFRLKK